MGTTFGYHLSAVSYVSVYWYFSGTNLNLAGDGSIKIPGPRHLLFRMENGGAEVTASLSGSLFLI